MPRIRWISGLLLSGVVTASPAAAFAADAPASIAIDNSDVAKLHSTLMNVESTPAERDEAARRLIARDSPEARAQVKADLINGNPPSQVAIANAIASTTDPDPTLIPLLGRLLGGKSDVTKAAAYALVNYRDRPEPSDLLSIFASNAANPNSLRLEVIGAMGSLIDKSVAAYLIRRLQDPLENSAIQRAAAEALGQMTGLDLGANSAAWLQWWTTASAWNQGYFRDQMLEARMRRFTQLQLHQSQLALESTRLLAKNYLELRDKLPDEANAALLNYLNSKSPEIRVLGTSLVYQDLSRTPPADNVKARLLDMIGDSDDTVRLEVVTVLLTINDAKAVAPLLDQLAVEHDAKIKVKIAQALGKIEDLAAITPLLKLVSGSQPDVAVAAAKAIAGALGEKLRQTDSQAANNTSEELRTIVDAIAKNPGSDELRAACMSALATLRDAHSEDTFRKALQPGETPDVQRAAIEGLGNLGITKADTLLAGELDSDERSIRLAAAQALLTVATPAVADTLNKKMRTETDPKVGDAIWQAFKGLFDKQSAEELKKWADQFQNYPPRRLDILVALADRLAKEHNDGELASTNQNIADAYMKLTPPQPLDAISSLEKAIAYWRSPPIQKGADEGNLEEPIVEMLQYMVKAGKYSDAVAFGGKQIALNAVYQRAVIVALRDEADQLISSDAPNASLIVNQALKIPNLEQRYIDQLHAVQRRLEEPGPR